MARLIVLFSLLIPVVQLLIVSNFSQLTLSIESLSRGLESKTNIIYTEDKQPLDIYAQISQTLKHNPSILLSQNVTQLISSTINPTKPLLMILLQLDPNKTLQIFELFPVEMQRADFLIVGSANAASWLNLLSTLWQLGYPNVLIFNSSQSTTASDQLFTSDSFPNQRLQSSSIDHYLWARRHWFDNLRGWKVRVGLYNNPPRTLVFPEHDLYGGYALLMLKEFLCHRNAQFVPKLTTNFTVYSPTDCLQMLRSNHCELCGDLFAYNTNYSFTDSYMYLYANILIPNAKPKSKNFYISAPMQLKTWLLVIIYVLLISGFISFIVWLQRGRFEFGKQLLQILGSLISGSLQLREIQGRIHYILFIVIALGGLICSTYYLAFLKTILSTGLYEPQINNFEELVRQNISFIVGDYDKTVLKSYDFPDILWNITRVVPYDFITKHRRVFDPNYAYLAHSDRLLLFSFQQQYMMKPRMRPLPIDIMHSLPGFPMRREWLLKFKLSEALLNCFNSGLMQKLAADTNRQTIHIGYLSLMPSERYETQPLALDYFAMPLKILCSGLGLAFICFLCELLWQCVKQKIKNRSRTTDDIYDEHIPTTRYPQTNVTILSRLITLIKNIYSL
ncbi:uncharacterized protein LOC133845050 [Drosophila sulfurigaster albostrigata]|uniref:uncharacterized protein LOC133845050 n=1 Tax=Drosophila sulfurigaster albostrigata TaxID=89887 RepID=UPI002D219121|nr:uncharacterized protein LOC133845050 [Drosophila sulfurigaster albostrigata]